MHRMLPNYVVTQDRIFLLIYHLNRKNVALKYTQNVDLVNFRLVLKPFLPYLKKSKLQEYLT